MAEWGHESTLNTHISNARRRRKAHWGCLRSFEASSLAPTPAKPHFTFPKQFHQPGTKHSNTKPTEIILIQASTTTAWRKKTLLAVRSLMLNYPSSESVGDKVPFLLHFQAPSILSEPQKMNQDNACSMHKKYYCKMMRRLIHWRMDQKERNDGSWWLPWWSTVNIGETEAGCLHRSK